MLKRLVVGLFKGLVVGLAIGAGIQYGLGWQVPSGGLLGYLLAMGAAGTAGVFAGKPPWHEGAWIEAALKGMVGVGLGALAYWAAVSWAAIRVPLPGLGEPDVWTALPVLFLPLIAGVYGSLVELDNTDGEQQAGAGSIKPPKTRVSVDDDEAEHDETRERRRSSRGRAI
jgi:hypothetical protein